MLLEIANGMLGDGGHCVVARPELDKRKLPIFLIEALEDESGVPTSSTK